LKTDITALGPWPDWDDIDHVLLDMDGTLLNLGFDNEFFSEFLPAQYALANNITKDVAQEDLFARYKAVEDTLQWFDIEYWGRELGLDVVRLTEQQSHKVSLHPDANAFLKHVKTLGKPASLITNAHHTTLKIKIKRTGIDQYLEKMLCSSEVGVPKHHLKFWDYAQKKIGYDPARTLFIDDSEKVLLAARKHGLRYLLHRSKPSMTDPPRPSDKFHSIEDFHPLMHPRQYPCL
jgi:putative hydrolase of the HAD superfamily